MKSFGSFLCVDPGSVTAIWYDVQTGSWRVTYRRDPGNFDTISVHDDSAKQLIETVKSGQIQFRVQLSDIPGIEVPSVFAFQHVHDWPEGGVVTLSVEDLDGVRSTLQTNKVMVREHSLIRGSIMLHGRILIDSPTVQSGEPVVETWDAYSRRVVGQWQESLAGVTNVH